MNSHYQDSAVATTFKSEAVVLEYLYSHSFVKLSIHPEKVEKYEYCD